LVEVGFKLTFMLWTLHLPIVMPLAAWMCRRRVLILCVGADRRVRPHKVALPYNFPATHLQDGFYAISKNFLEMKCLM
jgi:hypothetical protein